MRPELVLHHWTVEDYDRMITAGVLSKDDQVELVEGEIVQMAPIGPVHGASVDALSRFLFFQLGDRYQLRVQGQVQLPPRSQTRPDLAVLRARGDHYRSAQPGPSDVLLVIEVADSSLAADRARKIPMYGRAGIPEAWLVDLVAEAVEVYDRPGATGYARRQVRRRGEIVESIEVAQPRVPVDAALALEA